MLGLPLDLPLSDPRHPFHVLHMEMALEEAGLAADADEVPVGAVIVHRGQGVIARAHNQREQLNDPTAHAEMIALTQAARALGSWRLEDCLLYVTLEPCPMCPGAAVQARIPYVVYGCADPKAGACDTLYHITNDPRLNHRAQVIGGVLADRCAAVLSDFFAAKRRLGEEVISNRFSHAARLGIRSLAAHRLRSALTALGIILGVASVIVMLAVGEAARAEALRQLEDLGANTILLRSVKPQDPPDRQAGVDLTAYGLTDADLGRIRGTVPTVQSAMPARESRRVVRHRDRKLDARLLGVTPDFFPQHNLVVSRGRAISSTDERRYENVAVLGAGAADALFPGMDPVGRSISLDDIDGPREYKVVGVTEPKTLAGVSEAGAGADLNRVVFIPFATDRLRFGREVVTLRAGSFQVEKIEISQVTVTVAKTEDVRKTAAVLESLLGQYHPRKDVTVFVPLELLQKAEQTQRLFTLVLGAIAGVSLVVGGIGIMNIMLATVTERTQEIGIRRALGAKRRDIAAQFLVETVILSCGGGLLGVLVGVAGAYLLTWAAELPVVIRLWSPVLAFGVSVLVGLVSGIYPARRAARLDPVEALRHE